MPKVKLLERLFRSVKSNINTTQRRDAWMHLASKYKFRKVAITITAANTLNVGVTTISYRV